MPEDLCYLSGKYLEDYLHDVEICQAFARRSREKMAEIILERTGMAGREAFHTIHNYIDTDEMILRKGAIAAHRYIMYIGRARKKNGFSLRKRCKEYLKDERIQIMYMRETWGDKLYFYYLPLDNDDDIEKIERELIRVIIPPCNTEIPDQYISFAQPTAAF